jgi:hypothetical protein
MRHNLGNVLPLANQCEHFGPTVAVAKGTADIRCIRPLLREKNLFAALFASIMVVIMVPLF